MNRKEITTWFLTILNELQENNANIPMYETHFKSLSDDEFVTLMGQLKSGETTLPYYCANLHNKDVDIARALKVGENLGLDFFQRLWVTDDTSGVRYLTPEKYFIVELPIRRQSQHVDKGKSVALTSDFTDMLTGQAAGPSSTSRLSLPEIMNLESAGLHNAIYELINVRGGNVLGFRTAKRRTLDSGHYSLKEIDELGSRPTSTATLHAFLKGMHYEDTV